MLIYSLKDGYSKTNSTIIFGFVLLLFFFDFLDKIEIFYGIDLPKLNRYLKVGALAYAIGFIIFNTSYIMEKLKYLVYSILALSVIFLLKYNYWNLYVQEFFRYGFILILFPYLHFFYKNSSNQEFLKSFYKVLKIVMIVNIVAIIIGIIFNIEVFHTYQYNRIGYNGIILSQGLTPYVYMSSTVIFLVIKDYKMLTLVVLASIISGVKGAVLGEFMLMMLFIYYNKNLSRRFKIKTAVICLFLFIVTTVIIFNTTTFRTIIKEDGFISAIFSYRIDNLIEIIETSPPGSFSYLIGAVGLETIRVEMQLLDIILFFGIIGVLVILFFMVSFYKDIIKSSFSKAFFIAALSLSFLSGNLFYIPLSILLFLLTCFSLNQIPPSLDKNT